MFSYFENRKTTYFDVFCLNFGIKMKIETLFPISYFNLSKKRNSTLGTRIQQPQGHLIFHVNKFIHKMDKSRNDKSR